MHQTSERIALPPLARAVLKLSADTYTPSADLCAAFLLLYVVSDLSAERVGDCYQLDGLPVLPTRSGDVGRYAIRDVRALFITTHTDQTEALE